MTVAQVIEVGCMFSLPLLRPRDRMKALMLVGLGGYALRGWVMAVGWTPAVVAIGVPMHGMGYTFFLLVASTYLDREAPPHLRASAQGIITFVSGGVGVWVGNAFAAAVVDRHRVGTVIDWQAVWVVPLVVCSVVVLAFAFLFYPPPARDRQIEDASPDADELDPTSR
jgi:MFS family permease